ncbi:exodeoxyribonuclease [Salmonella bongori]|uniref:RecE family exodeoxyribonuclease n=1 Tax=Salmonella bongori TaxID=54736 RepID=UPI0012897225|nr:RecE family exodeoxyribonuclease [Salmonella bongori]ECG8260414.1 exodeoxyribonuclease [Salmonella bongori serovar 48:i:-]ECG9254746.1 exodeoxyribonuclease [Salmonella bongori]EDP8708214.1 exodeoxyribonuclease [Salmonella bongori]EDP8725834.1 exodeoxyribonuclease [Salmonella bongori]EEO9371591.1 exodeoxyribonuclease [Salmonella bongori]
MSENNPVFLVRRAKKQSGAPDAVLWCSDDFESASATLDYLLIKSGRKLRDYFKAVATHFPIVNELPPEGEISFTFCDFYQLGDDGMTWEQIPGVTLPSRLNKNVAENTAPTIADGVDTDTGEVIDDQRTSEKMNARVFSHGKLSFEKRVFGTWLFGLFDELSKEQLADVARLELDMDATYAQNVMLACRDFKVRQLQHVFPETLVDLFAATKSVWPETGKAPVLGSLICFFAEWIDAHNGATSISGHGRYAARDEVTEKWRRKYTRKPSPDSSGSAPLSLVDAARQQAVEQQINAIAKPEDKPRPSRSGRHTFRTLNLEIGCALWDGDLDYHNLRPAMDFAKRLIADDREDWKRWNAVVSTRSDILCYDRQTILDMIRTCPNPDIYKDPVALKDYVTRFLENSGVFDNPSDEEISRQLAARRGEFVPGISDPDDPKWDKPSLPHDIHPAPEESNKPYEIASNDGEKQEVENTSNVQVQEADSNEEPAGDAVQTIEGSDCADKETTSVATTALEGEWLPNPDGLYYFEPGRYEGIPNEIYHSANGISSTMLKDVRISPMYYHERHIARTIPRQQNDAMLRGAIIHSFVLEPEKFAEEFAIPAEMPADVVSTSNDLIAIIKEYNASLPALMTPDELKAWLEAYNSKLTPPLSLSAGAEETGMMYTSLPLRFQRIPSDAKPTATAQKACIKEYNASLPPMLKTSGTREQLLDQIATVDPAFAEKERSKRLPYNTSGTKEQLTEIVRSIRPDTVTADDWHKQQEAASAGKTMISLDMYEQAKNIRAALEAHPSASRLLNHPTRQSEVSYFGFDEETGLEIRVRPDLEITLPHTRIGGDLKTTSLGYVKQDELKARLHREIISRDYHLSAAMYCDTANLDQFFWIFVNRDEGYHWIAVVEASPDLLELGRKEYRKALRTINACAESNQWPAPITEDYTDELNDFDLRRLQALDAA